MSDDRLDALSSKAEYAPSYSVSLKNNYQNEALQKKVRTVLALPNHTLNRAAESN
jgi:hypothetical protein